MISWIKAQALKVVDKVHYEPYVDFTRPYFPASDDPLHITAAKAEVDFGASLIMDGMIGVNWSHVEGNVDIGDQALWHGIYTATKAWEYALSISNGLVAEADKATRALETRIQGLGLHQSHGILARGFNPKTGELEFNASNDSACGHLLGLWASYKCGNQANSERAKFFLREWAHSVLSNGHALVNPDGKRTKFGTLEQGIKSDPLRITLLLAIYGAAFAATNEERFINAAKKILKKHSALIPFGKTRLAWLDKHTDTHRAAIQLRIMQECGMYAAQKKLINKGLSRLLEIGVKQGNPWIQILCGTTDAVRIKGLLSEFSVEKKRWSLKVDNVAPGGKTTKIVASEHTKETWTSPVKKWGGQLVSLQPLPLWARGSQDFFWQRHPYSVQDWPDRTKPEIRHNSGDFLAVYWFARLHNVLRESD